MGMLIYCFYFLNIFVFIAANVSYFLLLNDDNRCFVSRPNMATVYSDQGCGIRPPVVFYNRANEAAQMLRKGDFEWDKIFPRCRWFHTGGLYTALGDYEFILDAMQKVQLSYLALTCLVYIFFLSNQPHIADMPYVVQI